MISATWGREEKEGDGGRRRETEGDKERKTQMNFHARKHEKDKRQTARSRRLNKKVKTQPEFADGEGGETWRTSN